MGYIWKPKSKTGNTNVESGEGEYFAKKISASPLEVRFEIPMFGSKHPEERAVWPSGADSQIPKIREFSLHYD